MISRGGVDSPHIPWTTHALWVISCGTHIVSRGTHPVDYTNPVDDVRGELISRGYDIPWTTCTHGIQGCCPLDIYPVDNIPWINSLLLMNDQHSGLVSVFLDVIVCFELCGF